MLTITQAIALLYPKLADFSFGTAVKGPAINASDVAKWGRKNRSLEENILKSPVVQMNNFHHLSLQIPNEQLIFFFSKNGSSDRYSFTIAGFGCTTMYIVYARHDNPRNGVISLRSEIHPPYHRQTNRGL